MKKGRTSANLEEGEIEEDETISIGMVHGQKSSPKWVVHTDESYCPTCLPKSHLKTDLFSNILGFGFDS